MFPRLAFRAASTLKARLSSAQQSRCAAAAPLLRLPTHNSGLVVLAVRGNKTLTDRVQDWEKAHQLYYGPERDTKNFPITVQPERPPPTKLGFIPKTWFDFFYDKTGVTGPYVLGGGLVTFLLSKEIFVVEHGFAEVLAFTTMFVVIAKKFGPAIGAFLDKRAEAHRAAAWEQPLADAKEQCKANIATLEKSIWQEEGQANLFDSKRENVDLQLEAAYRQRLAEVHQAVKKRLDYQLDVETTTRAFQQQHMVNWIVNNVVKSITPQQEKDSITKCIQDLKALSQRPT